MNRAFGIFVVGAALGGVSGVAHAQDSSSSKPQTELYVGVEVRHDSNVVRNASVASQQGLVNGDERLTPTIGVTISRPLGRNTLLLQGSLGYDFYRRNHQLNRERLNLLADGRLRAGFCELDLSPSFTRQQSDLSQLAYVSTAGIDSVRNTQQIQKYSAEVSCGRSFGLRPFADYQRAIGDNSSALRKVSDYRSNRYGGGIHYTNPIFGDLSLGYHRTDADYPHRSGTILADQTSFHTDEATVGIRRNIGAVVTADASVGYVKVSPSGTNVASFSGISYQLAVQIRPVPRLQVGLNFSADATPSLSTAALYQREHTYGGELDYALTSRTSLNLGASRQIRNYAGATNFFGPVLTNDHFSEIHAGVGLKLGERLRFDLVGGHEVRRANGTIYDYSNTYIALRTRFTL
jgi:hypothetical protein